jgi:hypothetical protein
VPYLRRLVADFPPGLPGFDPTSGHLEFVVDRVALGQVSYEHFGSPANSHSTKCSVRICTIGQLVADICGPHLTRLKETWKVFGSHRCILKNDTALFSLFNWKKLVLTQQLK